MFTLNGDACRLGEILGMQQESRVTWDMVHYDVQLIGGIALHQGKYCRICNTWRR